MINKFDFKSDTNINKKNNHFSLKIKKIYVFNFFQANVVSGRVFLTNFSIDCALHPSYECLYRKLFFLSGVSYKSQKGDPKPKKYSRNYYLYKEGNNDDVLYAYPVKQ